MLSHLVMTIIGPDRPGLVESLASTITAHGGNWLESRMGHLGGQFAGILRVQVAEESVVAMTEALRAMESEEFRVVVNRGAATDAVMGAFDVLHLEVIGHDRPGIVSEITRVLASFQINVESLETERISAPMSGEMLFQARARIDLPSECSEAGVREKLEEIASDLMVEFRLEQD